MLNTRDSSSLIMRISIVVIVCVLGAWAGTTLAQENKTKSVFSPIIDVDVQNGFLFISSDSGLLIVQASEEAKPHLGKLPISGMIDIVIEFIPGRKFPLVKTWKVAAGESACKIFDGKTCR